MARTRDKVVQLHRGIRAAPDRTSFSGLDSPAVLICRVVIYCGGLGGL